MSEAPSSPRIGPAITAYVVTFLAGLAVFYVWRPTGWWLALLFLPAVLSLGWLIRQSLRARRGQGTTTPAQRAYLRRFFPMMLLYVVAIMGASWVAAHHAPPAGPLAWGLAILPALPLLGVIWAMGRMLVEEQDEYQRMLQVRQMLIATGIMLAVTSVWGFLEQFEQVPHIPLYYCFIVWCAGLGIGAWYNEARS